MPHIKLVSGSSHPELAAKMARWLNLSLTACTVNKFANKETNVLIDQSIRENDVFVVQTAGALTNDRVIELIIMISACKLASSKRVTAVIPLFFYSKQSKRKSRSAITGKLIANMLTVAGVDHIITMDLHASQMQGFFSVPVDNLFSEPTLASYIRYNVPGYKEGVVVAKNPGGMKRVTSLSDRLGIDFALVFTEKSKKTVEENDALIGIASLDLLSNHSTNDETMPVVDGGGPSSAKASPLISDSACVLEDESNGKKAKREKKGRVVGDVAGRVCFIADDMIDGIKSFQAAAKTLCDNGAKRVYLVATHGVFADDALQKIEDDPCIHEVIVTNTVPLKDRSPLNKIRILDVSSVFAEAVRRTHNGESLSFLLNNISS